jgi:hypothetical protein
MHKGFWLGNMRGRSHLDGLGADGRIILKRIFKKSDSRRGVD